VDWLQKGIALIKRHSASVGIDLGRHYVRAVEISHTPDKEELIGGCLAEFKLKDAGENLVKALKAVTAGLISKSPVINAGIAGENVLTRHVDMPRMNDADLRNALKYEAQKYMLSKDKVGDLITDFHRLPEVKTGSDKMRIIFVAAKRSYLNERLKLLKKGGIKPTFLDVNTFSLINCFNFNHPEVPDSQSIVLLNIEYGIINMSILQGRVPYFTRDITLEEGEWANLILEKLDGFLAALEQGSPGANLSERFRAIQPLLSYLSREVKLSINYYESQFEKSVKKIFVSGEATRSRDTLNFFSEQLGIEVNPWDPFSKVTPGPKVANWEKLKSAGPRFALAVGLALRR
jgi:type IV pilus assembly protein PilM